MWQTKKFKLVGKIEGKKYYKYDSKKKKFTRDRKSKVVQNAKKKTISVKITTNNAVIAKSIPSELIGRRLPARPPIAEPITQ